MIYTKGLGSELSGAFYSITACFWSRFETKLSALWAVLMTLEPCFDYRYQWRNIFLHFMLNNLDFTSFWDSFWDNFWSVLNGCTASEFFHIVFLLKILLKIYNLFEFSQFSYTFRFFNSKILILCILKRFPLFLFSFSQKLFTPVLFYNIVFYNSVCSKFLFN